jgi:predicted MFS family arabinose efflux permease
MRVKVVVSAVVMVACSQLVRTVWSLAEFLVAGAELYGSSNPAANLARARHTHPERSATVFGVKHAGIPASTLLAGLAVPAIVVGYGWRAAFVVAAFIGPLVWVLIPRMEAAQTRDPATVEMRGRPLGRSGLVGLAAAAALGAVAAAALGTFMVSAALSLGYSEGAAGILQSVGSGLSIVMRVSIGRFFDHRKRTGFAGLVALMAIGTVAFAALPFVNGAAFAVVVVIAYMTGWGWPGLMTYTVVDANRASAASASSVVQAGVFVGAGLGPLVLGSVFESSGAGLAWGLVAGCLAAASITASLTGRTSMVAAVGGAESR